MKKLLGKLSKRSRAETHYEILKRSDVDWQDYADKLPENVDDPIKYFISHYRENPLVIPGWFDSAFYLEAHPDVRHNGGNPLLHFLLYGRHEGRAGCAEMLGTSETVEQAEQEVDAARPSRPSESALERELLDLMLERGVLEQGYDPKPVRRWIKDLLEVSEYGAARIEGLFDQALYEAIYPDIARAPINPLHHFIQHGSQEGRVGWLDMDEMLTEGHKSRNELLDTILLVSHDASATGAPAVALEVARRLGKRYNVITATLRDGALRSHFVESAILHLDLPEGVGAGVYKYVLRKLFERVGASAALLNSVESGLVTEALAALGLPTMSLLHEFAEYTRPVTRMSRVLLASDLTVYPASTLAESGLAELRKKLGVSHQPTSIRIQPQGYLGFKSYEEEESFSLRSHLSLAQDDLLVVGAGHVQPRKGVDWFLQTCLQLQQILHERGDDRAERLQFVWLGNGYDENDIVVSVWLDAYIQRTGMAGRVHFPGAVHDVAAALEDADLYLLTSRLDPFPNVAVDAMNADCGVGVFEQCSGIADFVAAQEARAVLAPYGDTRHLAEKLADNLDWLTSRDGRNTRICRDALDFDQYVEILCHMLGEAGTRRREVQLAAQNRAVQYRFDGTFYSHSFDDDPNRLNHFLSLLRKGVAIGKPFPGSDIQAVLDSRGDIDDFETLVEKAMTVSVTDMPVHRLSGSGAHRPYRGRIALQFHVYFAELISEYCTYFRTLQDHDVDLFVTHIPNLTDRQIAELDESISGTFHLKQVENRGRDVHPFHRQFVEEIQGNYDVVGHFHTKKSKDLSPGTGDTWRQYLLSNLMGSPVGTSEVLAHFGDHEVGLVFAEDPHLVDEGQNGPHIEKLLEPLGLKRRPHYRHFPLGTMFWARVDALVALDRWPEGTFNYPEPIPYDGSVLHAFERVIPQLVEEAGFKIQRVYTSGTNW
ncbi:glycosyltransferase [Billgrantia diversa]|uniref:rhamnan synthesis F family protein n=1 Tax=Halomonas sp. MCCC 1A13316 TaxID=2733487 RepID=UPI0018A5E517|nr:rhamnan synthesis F family protein [Halomonas sp. MCCC 1A13316]QOR37432.1 glycosyltransferase [Halomonas sp. MCCC 1A13316]